MSQETEQDKLEIIIDYLKKQGAALAILDRRLDAFSIDLKVACESIRSVVERQSIMERDSATRSANCYRVMSSMCSRIAALEQMLIPVPDQFDPRSLDNVSKNIPVHKQDDCESDTKTNGYVKVNECVSKECYDNILDRSDKK